MLSLDSQRTNFNIVVSDLSRCSNSVFVICDKLSSMGYTYFACIHDKDKKEDGSLKLKQIKN